MGKKSSGHISCPNCGEAFPNRKARSEHIKTCNPWNPDGILPCVCEHRATSNTQMKRHKTKCLEWSSRDKNEVKRIHTRNTCLDRYGVSHPMLSDEVKNKVAETCLEKYGVENPFASKEVQDKIKNTNIEKYGHECSLQAPEVKKKVLRTWRENYGEGVINPFQVEEVKEKIRETCLEKYGHENPQQVPEIRKRTKNTVKDRYGYDHVLSVPEIRESIKATCQERYGGPSPASSPEIQEKIKQTWINNYGVPFPPQSVQNTFESPNLFEQRIATLSDRLYFTGDGAIWIHLPTLGKFKNPDFIVLPPGVTSEDVTEEFLSTFKPSKVVEGFGTYWHGPQITGVSNEEHEAELVSAYAAEGIECLIIWEGDEIQVDISPFLS